MDTLKNIADSIPIIKKISQETKTEPMYCLIAISFISLILIQKTILGNLLSCLLSVYFPVREAILSIQSPNPKIQEQKKLLIVFIAFSGFCILESIGIKKILPIFSILKILSLFWLGYDEKHANAFYEIVLKKIPQKWLNCGDSIENAVRKAAKSVESKIKVSSNSIEIKKD